MIMALYGVMTLDEMLKTENYGDDEGRRSGEHAAQGPPVVAVSGVKNSGKTTLLAGIIPVLKKLGLKVAVIKHDGHDFTPDVPGTDSFRLRASGAAGVAVYSASRCMIIKEKADVRVEDIADQFYDMDLILLEGGKFSGYRKVEVVRGAVSRSFVSDPATLLALCTDEDLHVEGVPVFSLNDYEGIAGRIVKFIREEDGHARRIWQGN
ncbi:MAG: molybdopterin-guanine dinucleotide biosynthesis protein B [Synergistaceae bacterium]|jgi:molybdopterin-guanine dinucleotide biosynthesis protein B|nr:molybdopterin-guanine dinucleotide biosynthesis protein B [Synergistaceae bacterium]